MPEPALRHAGACPGQQQHDQRSVAEPGPEPESNEQQLLLFFSANLKAGATRAKAAVAACHRAEVETLTELQELVLARKLAAVGLSPLTEQRVTAAFAPTDFSSLLQWLPARASCGGSCLSTVANSLSDREWIQVFCEQGATSLVDRHAYLAMLADHRRVKFGLPPGAPPASVAACLAAEAAWLADRGAAGGAVEAAVQRLAFAGVLHSRLAEGSPAGRLPIDVVHRINECTLAPEVRRKPSAYAVLRVDRAGSAECNGSYKPNGAPTPRSDPSAAGSAGGPLRAWFPTLVTALCLATPFLFTALVLASHCFTVAFPWPPAAFAPPLLGLPLRFSTAPLDDPPAVCSLPVASPSTALSTTLPLSVHRLPPFGGAVLCRGAERQAQIRQGPPAKTAPPRPAQDSPLGPKSSLPTRRSFVIGSLNPPRLARVLPAGRWLGDGDLLAEQR